MKIPPPRPRVGREHPLYCNRVCRGKRQLESTLWNRALAMHPLSESPGVEVVRIAEVWTGDTLLLRDMPLHKPEPGLVELTETSEALLKEYQQRFSLRFEDETRKPTLIPMFPPVAGRIPEAKELPSMARPPASG